MMNDITMNGTMDMADGTMEEPTEEVSDDGRRKLMDVMDAAAEAADAVTDAAADAVMNGTDAMMNATDAMMNGTMMNDTMMNGTMDMMNGTMEEPAEEVSDDGRRKLMQLEGLQEAAMGV